MRILERLPESPTRCPSAGATRLVPALLLTFVLSLPGSVDAAGLLSSTGPIDRRTDSIGWCPSSNLPVGAFEYPSVSFVADGPRATIEFIAANLDSAGTYWTQQSVDNLCLVTRATFDTYFADSSACTSCNPSEYFAFDVAPPGEILYLERFDTGAAGWDLSGGAFYNATQTAARDPGGMCDVTGGSLALGAATGPDTVRTHQTVSGLTPGTEYVFTWWWRYVGDALVTDEEIFIEVWGTDPWLDVSPAVIATSPESHGGAWGDFDSDGDPDLYVTRYETGVANRLLRNDGGMSFSDVTTAVIADSGFATGVTWIDPDNDHDLDLMLANQIIGTNRFYENDAGNWVDQTHPLLMGTGSTASVTWADWDLDGDLDGYRVEFGGANVLIRNDGQDLADVTPAAMADTSNGSAAAWSDLDLDGDPDLYLVNRDTANRMFRNDGGGSFVDVTAPNLADLGPGTTAVWADLDNDLDPDLILGNIDGTGVIYRNDGGGVFTKLSNLNEGDLLGIVTGDWDLDGDVDFAVARQSAGNRIFRNDGAFTFTQTAAGPLPMSLPDATLGLSAADADSDGDLDLFVANDNPDNDRLLENDQTTGHDWLHVDLKGTTSNSYGIGAKIRVTAGQFQQFREVGDELVFLAQNDLTAEFGLGFAPMVNEIQVTWPSGIVQYVSNIAVNQKITITEGDGTSSPVVTAGPEARFGLREPRPNPFGDVTALRFDLPVRSVVDLAVFDVRGRRVSTLVRRAYAAGSHTVSWNGTDGGGHPAAPGIYFVRLRAGDRDSVQRVVRIR